MACSTTAVHLTVNQRVAGSNPATPVDRPLKVCYNKSVTHTFIMNLNVENLVRSGVVLVVGLPLILPLGSAVGSLAEVSRQSPGQRAARAFKDELTVPCLKYIFTSGDSKSEREAKNEIDDVVGEGANYGNVCKYVL